MTLTPEILKKLKAPFKPDQHQDRKLKGGDKWFYIKWQDIRDRVEEVDPNYGQEFGSPEFLGKYCFVACTLTIHGVSRQAIGNAEIELISGAGNNMERGNAIERAIADAFKNAAEAFGVAAYLDDQKSVIRILSSVGDSRAYTYAKSQEQIAAGLPPISDKRNNSPAIAGKPAKPLTRPTGFTPSWEKGGAK